jgi:hypothetical protein
MAQHQFKVGDLVRIGGVHARPMGIFEVAACLPKVDSEAQYRIKGGGDSSERVLQESQLIRAVQPQPRR